MTRPTNAFNFPKFVMGTAPETQMLAVLGAAFFILERKMVVFGTCCALVIAAPVVAWIARAVRG